ncbi:hypothetical protein PTKIN_Ptkin11bG0001500 [Pterospermum kingtungense]
MLQWMGGSRRKVSTSRKSTHKRQKHYFEQRKRQQQTAGSEGSADETAISGQPQKQCRSLDILSLLNFSTASDEAKSCPSRRDSKIDASKMMYHIPKERTTIITNSLPPSCSVKIKEAGAPPSIYQGESPSPKVSLCSHDNSDLNETNNSPDVWNAAFENQLSVFDMLNDDASEGSSERIPVHEAHVAFSVEGLGKIRTETPLHSPKQECRISSDDCSLPWNVARQLNSSKISDYVANDLELEVDAMMQDIDVPLSSNSSKFSVDITDSHCNRKPKLSTFTDHIQLDGHYRNRKCPFGDTGIFYNIRREDIWDARDSSLDDDFLHEIEDDISWKYWPRKIDGESGDFLDYEEREMSDNAFEGHHMLRKRDVKATKLNSLEPPSPKHTSSEVGHDFTTLIGVRHTPIQRNYDIRDLPGQPGWPFFETEDAKDNLSLLSEESCSSTAVRGETINSSPPNLMPTQSKRISNTFCRTRMKYDANNVFTEETHCKDGDNLGQRSGKYMRTAVLPKLKATKPASSFFRGEIGLSQAQFLGKRCNSVDIDLSFSSSRCTSEANLPSVGSKLWAEDHIGAFSVPELNLDFKSCFNRPKHGESIQYSPVGCFTSSGLHRETRFPDLPIAGNISGDDKRKSKFPTANCEQFKLERENCIGNDLLFSEDPMAMDGSDPNNKDLECEAKDGSQGTKESLKTTYSTEHSVETSSSVKMYDNCESKDRMGSKICMNSSCGTATTHEWKKGWPLRSGGFANLCYRCGSAYEDRVYCDTFHSEESGWRECCLCGKRLHCGCIASKSLLELLDYGGVGCTSCAESSRLPSLRRTQIHGDEIPKGFSALPINNAGSNIIEGKAVGDHVDERTRAQLCKIMEATECNLLPQSQRDDENASLGQHRGEEVMFSNGDVGTGFPNAMQTFVRPPNFGKTDNARPALGIRDFNESLSQPSLSMTLGGSSGNTNFVLPFSSGLADGKEHSKTTSAFQQGQRSRPIFPKPPKNGLATISEPTKSMLPQARIARPPVEGRGKNHLLPRYWPRITDQELQKLSGDLKSAIVPLFEKVLSASDAGRIGRLVLPKACAEAYFPPISQSEGVPLRIQDVKGKEWTFQFRFWPNNNSRMYVLEGVTPCIQSMQLQARDTVTFSRIDPGGKLVMGFRKATDSDTQEGQASSFPNGAHSGGTSHSGGTENLSTASAYSDLFQIPKRGNDPFVNALSENLSLADGNNSWVRGENHGDRANEDPVQQAVLNAEKKRTRNIGSKSKRLLMHNEDALELRLTWEEAQDLLRPPPSVKPSIVTIEDHEFEEYDEPPVFGKRTIFAARLSGGQEQWAQCDDCSKWRRLPIDVLLPPKWTCSDNVWDSIRCSCSAAEEISPKEAENLLKMGRDLKKRKILESPKLVPEREPSGLDALASAAVLGDNLGESSVGATTKHPRHRPGCSCIVCIQPPSGKGKHKPTCTCNVCMTVKRRFKTLMLRKKKRQSEREAEMLQKNHKDESELNDTRHDHSENEGSQNRIQAEVAESSAGQIDLNCHPSREDLQLEEPGLNMMSLVEAASMPIENYVKQNGIANLISEQQGSIGSHLLALPSKENERHFSDEEFLASVGWERSKEASLERNGLQ